MSWRRRRGWPGFKHYPSIIIPAKAGKRKFGCTRPLAQARGVRRSKWSTGPFRLPTANRSSPLGSHQPRLIARPVALLLGLALVVQLLALGDAQLQLRLALG